MKAHELMIGNWVEIIQPKKGIYTTIQPSSFSINIEKTYKPIPLTEQWLIDFGFQKEVLSDESAYYYTLELNKDNYCDLSIVQVDKNGFLEVALFPYEDWFRYKYVHELQRLFYALTGKQLIRNHEHRR